MNILRYARLTSPFNDDTSLYFGFNEVYRALLYVLVIEAFTYYMKRYLKNLMLSDVEESRKMMLNETDPSGNTWFCCI